MLSRAQNGEIIEVTSHNKPIARITGIPAADSDLIDLGRNQFELSWRDFAIIDINEKLMRLAGEIAEAFALSAYDSVQLAAAKTLHDGSGQKILFACFDKRLQKASAVMGMQAVNPD